MDRNDRVGAKLAMRLVQREKRLIIIDHEAKMHNNFLDRSHYKRHELQNQLSYLRRYELTLALKQKSTYSVRKLIWEWQYRYVHLRTCFKSPLPWEANRYCRWV